MSYTISSRRKVKVNWNCFCSLRSGRLRQTSASKLSTDRRLPGLLLCRLSFLLWEREREGGSFSSALPHCFPVSLTLGSKQERAHLFKSVTDNIIFLTHDLALKLLMCTLTNLNSSVINKAITFFTFYIIISAPIFKHFSFKMMIVCYSWLKNNVKQSNKNTLPMGPVKGLIYYRLYLNCKKTYLSLPQWVPEISHHCPRTPFLLVGTQVDLRDDSNTVEKLAKNKQRPISPESGEKLARDLRAVKYVECSALTQVKRWSTHAFDDITAVITYCHPCDVQRILFHFTFPLFPAERLEECIRRGDTCRAWTSRDETEETLHPLVGRSVASDTHFNMRGWQKQNVLVGF